MKIENIPLCRAGIDFGTTFSTISAIVDDKLSALELEGTKYIPTILAIFDGNIAIGNMAKNISNFSNNYTQYYDLKRWVGVYQGNYHKLKEKIKPNYKCEFVDGDCVLYGVGSVQRPYSVKILISWFLKVLISLFEEKFKVKVVNLNVSVPADYFSNQRTFMRTILDKLSIKVDRILNEPSAAALFSVSELPHEDSFIIFDFGGGTFDVSYLKKVGKSLIVCDTEGDLFLGGRDIDNSIFNYILKRNNLSINFLSLAYLKEQVTTTDKILFNVLNQDNKLISVNFDRPTLNRIALPFVERAVKILDNLVHRNKITKATICLVGGSSLLTQTQDSVKSYSKLKNLNLHISKDLRLSVSYGCTILHSLIEDKSFMYIDVNSHPIFTASTFYKPEILIRKPLPIPMERIIESRNDYIFKTAIDIYEGDDMCIFNNVVLTKDSFRTDAVSKQGEGFLKVIKYNLDGNVSVELRSKDGKNIIKLKGSIDSEFKFMDLPFHQIQMSSSALYTVIFSLLQYHSSNGEFKNLDSKIPYKLKAFADKNGGIERYVDMLRDKIGSF